MTQFDKAAVNNVTGAIVDAAMRIHKLFGPGLLESAYECVLAHELRKLGFDVKRQFSVDINYEGLHVKGAFRVDLLVENLVIVEVKSLETLAGVHRKQIVTYLRVMNLPVGLLINFGNETLKQGIHRVMNGYLRDE